VRRSKSRGVAAEWFRSPDWDPTSRHQFEQRLSRASIHNRPQYLRIKALALRQAGHIVAAKELLRRVVVDYPGSLDCAFSTELLGDIEREQGSHEAAEAMYREVIRRWPDLNGTSGMVAVSLAELLTERAVPPDHSEALQLLDSSLKRGSMLNSGLFRWNVALARIAQQIGDSETVERAARTALSLMSRPPQFPRHPDVGIPSADDSTIAWLREMSTTGGRGSAGPRLTDV
jgi:predicted Zn-dependent protease